VLERVGRLLQLVGDLFELEDLQGVELTAVEPGEQPPVELVGLVLQPVDLDPVVGEVLQRLQAGHRLGSRLRAALQQRRLLAHLGGQGAQAGQDDEVGGGLHVVHDVVEVAGEGVDVLAVERRHEARVQLPEDRMGHLVAGVLEIPQLVRQLGAMCVVVDELTEDVGGRHQVLRGCGEQGVEARVLGGEAEGHASAPYPGGERTASRG
jgi:hypothetical protein